MTIKIKAPVICLDEAWLTEFVGKRLTECDKKYRIIRESDWRKLMRLVREVEDAPDEALTIYVRDALAALKEKGK